MRILDQGCYFSSVDRADNDELLSKTVVMSSRIEATACLLVDIKSFVIKKAWIEIHKSDEIDCPKGIHYIPELIGAEAYFHFGKELKKMPANINNVTTKTLLLECINGLIQSETYIIKERGYSSTTEYENFWKTEQINCCRYYSFLEKEELSWYEYLGFDSKAVNLFNRYQSYVIMEENKDNIMAIGSFNDSFHEMNIQLSLQAETGIIQNCIGEMQRAPGPVCFENNTHFNSFIGMQIDSLTQKDVQNIIGGKLGCFHLAAIMIKTIFAASNIFKICPKCIRLQTASKSQINNNNHCKK